MRPATHEELVARYGDAYKWYVCAAILIGLIAMISSATIVNVAMPDIMGELGLGQDEAQWLATGFLAPMTAAMLAASWVVQRFGSRATYVSALLSFALASVLGAFSPNDSVLILARVIQGVSAGIAQPLGMLAIFQVFPSNRRGMAMGFYGMGVILAPALGPALGGVLIDNYSWRYVFFLGIPFCFLGGALSLVFLPGASAHGASTRKPFDWIGLFLVSLCIASFLSGLSSGQRLGWDADFVRCALGCTLLSLIAFIWQEKRCASPILALDVYRNPRFVAASLVAFILGMGLFGSTYLVPLFVQTVQGYTPTESGVLLIPAGIALGVVFPLSGLFSDRVAPHVMIFCGLFVFAISSLLIRAVDVSTDFWTFAAWIVLGRVGLGLILPSLNSGALRVLDHQQLGHGAGAINFFRQLGGAIGVDALSIYLERQTAIYASEINATQSNSSVQAVLSALTSTLHRAGISGQANALEVRRFLSRMIEGQASVMAFQASFFCVALIFFIALIPAFAMRPKAPLIRMQH